MEISVFGANYGRDSFICHALMALCGTMDALCVRERYVRAGVTPQQQHNTKKAFFIEAPFWLIFIISHNSAEASENQAERRKRVNRPQGPGPEPGREG